MTSKNNLPIPSIEFQPQDAASTGIELVEIDTLYKRSHQLSFDPFSPHRVQFHHLIYITEGEGTHFIDFNHHPIRAGSFLFINKHQVHAFDADKQPQGLMFLFTQAFMELIRISIRMPVFASGFYVASATPVLTVNQSLKTSCDRLLSEISNVMGKDRYDSLIFQLLFTSLLLKLDREKPTTHGYQLSEVRTKQFSYFLSLVEKHFTFTKDAAEYAEMMGMSYKTLNQLCKLATNQTPKKIIDAHTILEAKRRLAIEDIQVTQLAYELGFEEVSNFAKYFKKHTLVTPNKFQDDFTR